MLYLIFAVKTPPNGSNRKDDTPNGPNHKRHASERIEPQRRRPQRTEPQKTRLQKDQTAKDNAPNDSAPQKEPFRR
jgi:hypothetical protein